METTKVVESVRLEFTTDVVNVSTFIKSELRHERDDDEDWSNIEQDQGE